MSIAEHSFLLQVSLVGKREKCHYFRMFSIKICSCYKSVAKEPIQFDSLLVGPQMQVIAKAVITALAKQNRNQNISSGSHQLNH